MYLEDLCAQIELRNDFEMIIQFSVAKCVYSILWLVLTTRLTRGRIDAWIIQILY